ncbi:MAG: hypothetical protein II835_18745, partial [Fibrobacter sp.]|nr:hypothetical protein [Fibrobacter sp.]
ANPVLAYIMAESRSSANPGGSRGVSKARSALRTEKNPAGSRKEPFLSVVYMGSTSPSSPAVAEGVRRRSAQESLKIPSCTAVMESPTDTCSDLSAVTP